GKQRVAVFNDLIISVPIRGNISNVSAVYITSFIVRIACCESCGSYAKQILFIGKHMLKDIPSRSNSSASSKMPLVIYAILCNIGIQPHNTIRTKVEKIRKDIKPNTNLVTGAIYVIFGKFMYFQSASRSHANNLFIFKAEKQTAVKFS